MKIIKKLRKRLQSINDRLPIWLQKLIHFVLSFYHFVILDFFKHDGLIYAAGLAFLAVLSTLPFLIMLGAVVGLVIYMTGGGEKVYIDKLLEGISDFAHDMLPYISDNLQRDLWNLVYHRAELGFLGFVIMILWASQLFRGFQITFGRVFSDLVEGGQPDKLIKVRGYWFSQLLFGAFILALGVGLLFLHLGLNVLSDSLMHMDPKLAHYFQHSFLFKSGMGGLFTVVGSILVFVLTIKMGTAKRIFLWPTILGGVVFYAAITISADVYSAYLSRAIPRLEPLYGSFTTAVVFLTWVYTLFVIFIVCAEFVKFIQIYFYSDWYKLEKTK